VTSIKQPKQMRVKCHIFSVLLYN